MKNRKVLVFRCTAIASWQISKRRSTSAARNSALNTPYPPLPYIFWTLWTWGFTRYHLTYTIPVKKIEQIAIEWSAFWATFDDFWGREPRLYSEICDFQNLSVYNQFSASNHIVCHRYKYEKVHNTFFKPLEPLWKSDLHFSQVSATVATLS